MIKRDKLILLVTAALSVAGFVVLVFIVVFRSSSTPAKQQEPITEVNRPADSIINYESGTQSRLFKLLTEERSLRETDLKARGKITSSMPEKSGTLLLSQRVRLDYLATPDFFQAEILTTDIASAKKEVIDWLLSHGISQSGICKLPIMFFLGQEPTDEFVKSRQTFSPLAPGC